MSEVIVITSGKGGVGKTTTSANLGSALAKLGKSVVIVDGDIGLRNLDVVMGLERRIVFDSLDVIEGRCKLDKALIHDRRFENLCILPATQSRDKDAIKPEQMKNICTELSKSFDFVIVDCPAGIEQGFKNAIIGANSAIVVATPEVSSVRDADRIIGLLESNELSKIKLIINRVKPKLIEQGDMLPIDDVLDILGIPLLGVVPDDESIIINTNKGEPVILCDCISGKAYTNIANRILGENTPILDFSVKESKLNKLLGLFNKKRR